MIFLKILIGCYLIIACYITILLFCADVSKPGSMFPKIERYGLSFLMGFGWPFMLIYYIWEGINE